MQDFINHVTKEAIDENCIKKILGLDRNITNDAFYFTDIISKISNLPVTKKNVLKNLSVFRPTGIKILFKEARALKYTWDDVVNDKFIEKWKTFFKELENVNPIKVGRQVFIY